jgi:hypothetical protein
MICPWSLEHEDVADSAFDVHRDYIVSLFDMLELRMD